MRFRARLLIGNEWRSTFPVAEMLMSQGKGKGICGQNYKTPCVRMDDVALASEQNCRRLWTIRYLREKRNTRRNST